MVASEQPRVALDPDERVGAGACLTTDHLAASAAWDWIYHEDTKARSRELSPQKKIANEDTLAADRQLDRINEALPDAHRPSAPGPFAPTSPAAGFGFDDNNINLLVPGKLHTQTSVFQPRAASDQER